MAGLLIMGADRHLSVDARTELKKGWRRKVCYSSLTGNLG